MRTAIVIIILGLFGLQEIEAAANLSLLSSWNYVDFTFESPEKRNE